MTIQVALTSLQSFVKSNFSGYTDSNCSIGDESIFNYIQTTVGAPNKCVLIEYAGFYSNWKTEFRSVSVNWHIDITAFFGVIGDDIPGAIAPARAFLDDLFIKIAQDPTLGGTVMRVAPYYGEAIMSYRRSNFDYIFVPIEVTVMDNLS